MLIYINPTYSKQYTAQLYFTLKSLNFQHFVQLVDRINESGFLML
jgi:hypothetical protein